MIADNYQVEVSDITSNNLHITDFKNLKPGMKLKIPFLSKPIVEVLEETESFISDYYPSLTEKFNEDNIKKENVKPIDTPTEVIEEKPVVKEEDIKREEKLYQPYGRYSGNIIPDIPKNYIKKI